MSQELPSPSHRSFRGRGAAHNPGNRFERAHYEPDPDAVPAPEEAVEGETAVHLPVTQLFADRSKTIIATNNSPDVGFSRSINPYRGCEHGCVYCYARPTHEYLGFSAGLDFETKILVKHDAAALLRAALLKPRYVPETIAISGVTDCYQPLERKLRITRSILEVLAEFRHPVGIVTKNHLVTRDIDLLGPLAAIHAAGVHISITTLDPKLTRIMEPRTSVPRERLQAIRELTKAGIPCGVLVAPVIPALTDHELPKILEAAAEHGAMTAGFVPLRLPHGVADLFTDFLSRHFSDRKEKVLNRIRDLRGGRLNDPNFRTRMRGQGVFAEQFRGLFQTYARKFGLLKSIPPLTTAHFRRPELDPPAGEGQQLPLF